MVAVIPWGEDGTVLEGIADLHVHSGTPPAPSRGLATERDRQRTYRSSSAPRH